MNTEIVQQCRSVFDQIKMRADSLSATQLEGAANVGCEVLRAASQKELGQTARERQLSGLFGIIFTELMLGDFQEQEKRGLAAETD